VTSSLILQDNIRVHYISVTVEIEIASFMYSGAIIIGLYAHARTPAVLPAHCAVNGNSIVNVRVTKSNFHCD